VLGEERRHRTLSTLFDPSLSVPASRLAREVAVEELPDGTTDVRPEHVGAVHVSLHHVHLPKLAAAGLVRYDAQGGTVEAVVDETEVPTLDV
jgi:hypothetical protein